MRNLLTACLPAIALLALGGCAGTSALTSSEDDGVYYSSKDRTTAVVSPAPATSPTYSSSPDEAANPDYRGNSNGTTARQNSQTTGSDQYYDNTYTYMRGVPGYGSSTYYGPGVSYYTPYSPYTSLSMSYGYGWGGGACGFSPYAYGGYDPFYSSFYSPYYGYGSGLSISFGFGRPWGYSRYGYGYSPYYGYGYGYGGFYDPYYYGGPFYGGYYGRGGYYGSNYYGSRYNGGGSYNGDGGNGRTYGHRTDRASDGRYPAGNVTSAPGTTTGPTGGGRVRTSEMVAPGNPGTGTPQQMPGIMTADGGRVRTDAGQSSMGTYNNRPRPIDATVQPQYRDMNQMTTATPEARPLDGQVMQGDSRGRWRNPADAQPQNNPNQMQPAASQPQDQPRRRGGFFQNVFGEPAGNMGQAADQPARQRSYDQPRQRVYEQPQQRTFDQPQQRTFDQPQQRSYSQPSYSAPSYSAPSYGGGGGGGGGHSRSRGN